jgi:phosphate transport system protein
MAGGPAQHMSHDFDAEMQAVRERFAAMAGRCRDQVHRALDAFWTGSKEGRADVEASDGAIDDDEKDIDALALRILALRQPVASDLRTLTALFKLVTDLERIGDEAVDIARGTASAAPDAEPIRLRLRQMAEASEEMLDSAVSSFLDGDAPAAETVRGTAGIVDRLYEEILGDSIAFMSRHPTEVPSAGASMNVAKCLRRIADHARNIAEGTLFVIRGEPMPR